MKVALAICTKLKVSILCAKVYKIISELIFYTLFTYIRRQFSWKEVQKLFPL